jgi:hypothetical protein
MPRPTIAEAQMYRAIRDKATRNADIVREVQQAVTEGALVVVGMRQHRMSGRKSRLASPIGARAASRASVAMFSDRLIVSGERSRLLTKQANNGAKLAACQRQ